MTIDNNSAALAQAAPADLTDERVLMLQFLSDVVTAAGLLRGGRTDKKLAERISKRAYYFMPQFARAAVVAIHAPADQETLGGSKAWAYAQKLTRQEMNAAMASEVAAQPAGAGAPSDAQYQEILRPVLSRHGMQRFLNGDEITLDPSDYRAIINRAIEFARQGAAPAQAKPMTDLLPPLGIRNDRDMLDYLADAFDNEISVCERCGHSEPTKDMDSAGFLRDYLATAPAHAGVAQAWSKEPPTEQADYWHWDGDEDHAPMIYHVLWSGTAKKCFVSIGQYDITNAIFCDDFGGWWLKIDQPSVRAATQASSNTGSENHGR